MVAGDGRHAVLAGMLSPMSRTQGLTLGALYHEMRNGLGDQGPVRVSIEFQQRSSTTPVVEGSRPDPAALEKRVLGADLEYEDRIMQGAAVHLGEIGGPATASFSVRRQGHGYLYSLDGGETWGRFVARPQIFDLTEFEEELGHVPIHDATIEQAVRARHLEEALDVEIDAAAFARLLRIFSADHEPDPDDLAVAAFSVTVAGGEDLSMLYWWSLTGFDHEEQPDRGQVTANASKVTCSVSIRLIPLGSVDRRRVRVDRGLPEVAHIDEVWALLRQRAADTVDRAGSA